MKLKKLTIENITSLKGRHVIEFDQINGHSDLFAITGPTGSGKSSLLSSISLALFGKTTKLNLTAGDFISTGEAGANIELTFSLGVKEYVATWFCNIKKKNGEFRSKPQIVRSLIEVHSLKECQFEDLIDLDFNQFHKVAILNQGRFADFLHASFTERKELLETLIGDRAILEIGKNLKTTISYYKQEIDKLSELSQQATLLTNVEKKQLEDFIIQSQKDIPHLQDKTNNLNLISKNIENATDIKIKSTKVSERVEKEKIEYELLLKELTNSKAKEHLLKTKYQKELDLYKKELPQLKMAIELNSQMSLIKHSIEKDSLKVNNIKKSIENLNSKNVQSNGLLLEKNDLILSKYTQFSTQEDIKTEEGLEDLAKYVKLAEDVKHFSFQINKYEEFKINYQETILKKEKQIEELQSTLVKNIKIEEIPQRLTILDKLIALELTKKQEVLQVSEKKIQISKLMQENIELKSCKENDHRQLILKNEMLEKKLLDLRETLGKINNTKRSLENYQELIERYDKNIHSCHVCNSSVDQELYNTTKELLKNLSINDNANIDTESIEALSKTCSETTAAIKLNTEQVSQIQSKILFYKKELEELDLFLNSKKNKNEDTDIEKEKSDLLRYLQIVPEWQSEVNQVKSKLSETLVTINKHSTLLIEAKSKQDDLSKHNYLQSIELKDQDFLDRQRKSYGEYKVLVTENNSYKKSIQQNNDEIKQEKVALDLLEQTNIQTHKQLTDLEKEYIKQDYPKDPQSKIDTNNLQIDEIKQQLHKQELKRREDDTSCQKKDSLIRTLSEQQDEFNKISLLYLSKYSEHKEIAINIQSEKITKHLDKITNWYSNKQNDNNDFSTQALLALKDDIIDENYKTLSTDLEEKVKENTVAQTRLSENLKQEDKILEVIKKQKLLKKELTKFLDLEQYIGKDRFRDYALSVIEKNLLVLANKEISQLADGRYKIIHAKEGKRSEFLVQDKWKGQSTRKVSTLSGGETFMLSLGLALALSNINRGSQEIGFFLIDEGFGSLDQESINDVLECLMGLRSRGKQIGIISHIKELTSRIPINIELSKNQWGESEVALTL